MGKDLRDRVTDGANLEYRKLGPVTLRGAHCAAVFADHAIITGADLAGAHLPLLHGVGLWATHANLTRARLWEANLDFADLRHANLSAADLWHASLRSADLRGADLRRARLWGTEFVDADLRGADLTGVVPDGSNFERAVYDSTTRWPSGFDPTLCRRAESP